MDQLATRSCAVKVWAGGNSTENFILEAETGCREKGELVPSLALSSLALSLGKAPLLPLHPHPTAGSKVCRAGIAPHHVKRPALNGPPLSEACRQQSNKSNYILSPNPG